MNLLNNSIIYIISSVLLQFFVEVKSQKKILNNLRYFHTATLINDKLYILGGITPSDNILPKETFLCLDVSVPFNTNELKWLYLSDNNIIPPHQFAASIKGGVNNNTLFLYGGESLSDKPMALVYTFDTKSNTWSIPEKIITGIILPTGKLGVTLTIDYDNGLIYKFGGSINNPVTYFDDMFILDSINLNWKKVSSINAPSPRVFYGGAILLPNKKIIYMGMHIV
jgi:hypothetical protein